MAHTISTQLNDLSLSIKKFTEKRLSPEDLFSIMLKYDEKVISFSTIMKIAELTSVTKEDITEFYKKNSEILDFSIVTFLFDEYDIEPIFNFPKYDTCLTAFFLKKYEKTHPEKIVDATMNQMDKIDEFNLKTIFSCFRDSDLENNKSKILLSKAITLFPLDRIVKHFNGFKHDMQSNSENEKVIDVITEFQTYHGYEVLIDLFVKKFVDNYAENTCDNFILLIHKKMSLVFIKKIPMNIFEDINVDILIQDFMKDFSKADIYLNYLNYLSTVNHSNAVDACILFITLMFKDYETTKKIIVNVFNKHHVETYEDDDDDDDDDDSGNYIYCGDTAKLLFDKLKEYLSPVKPKIYRSCVLTFLKICYDFNYVFSLTFDFFSSSKV